MNSLYVFVEGSDDRRFVENIYSEQIQSSYGECTIVEYAQDRPTKVNAFIKSIKSMPGADYIFLVDFDGRVNKKEITARKYKQLEIEKIFLVKFEIEAWIISGLDKDQLLKLKITDNLNDTEKITKEKFEKIIPKNFVNKLDFCTYIYENYNLNYAVSVNHSLQVFNSNIT